MDRVYSHWSNSETTHSYCPFSDYSTIITSDPLAHGREDRSHEFDDENNPRRWTPLHFSFSCRRIWASKWFNWLPVHRCYVGVGVGVGEDVSEGEAIHLRTPTPTLTLTLTLIDLATLDNLKKFLNLQVTIQNERSRSPRAISPISCVATPNTRERSRNAINCPACTSQSMSKFLVRMFFSLQVFDVAAGPSGISVSGRCGSLRQLR